MTVELDHLIVSAHDKQKSAQFLGDVIGVPAGEQTGPFVPLVVANGVTLDYDDRWPVVPQHYAFRVDDDTFNAALRRLEAAGVTIYADPGHHQPGQIRERGGRGSYFEDPNGHNMELFTTGGLGS